MNRRDLFFVTSGMLLVVIGVGALLYGSIVLALTAAFLLMSLLLIILVLQRRQLASVQERTLRVLRAQKESFSELQRIEKLRRSSRQRENTEVSTELSTKKIIGLLSAQQVSMELLNKRIEEIDRKIGQER